jgi:putative oxidoreductase
LSVSISRSSRAIFSAPFSSATAQANRFLALRNQILLGSTITLNKYPAHWVQFMAHFPDPVGIGPHASFLFAFFSDFVCAILLTIGLGTRWAALYCLGNIFVAWAFVHHFAFFGKGAGSDHGEIIVLYLGALLTLLIAGPGAASIDHILAQKL